MKHSPEEWKEIIKGKTIVQKQNRAKKCTSPIVFSHIYAVEKHALSRRAAVFCIRRAKCRSSF
jgi:hypothetical protein